MILGTILILGPSSIFKTAKELLRLPRRYAVGLVMEQMIRLVSLWFANMSVSVANSATLPSVFSALVPLYVLVINWGLSKLIMLAQIRGKGKGGYRYREEEDMGQKVNNGENRSSIADKLSNMSNEVDDAGHPNILATLAIILSLLLLAIGAYLMSH